MAQNEYMDYKTRATVPDADFTIFNMNDFRDALVQLGINVYKWNLPIPEDKDYKLKFYVQEYEKGKLIKDTVLNQWSTKRWGNDDRGMAAYIFLKNLRIITEMPEEDDPKFRLKFSLNNGLYQCSGSISDRQELRPYFLKQFDEIDFEVGKDIPMLLYTSGWDFVIAGEKSRRFCGANHPNDVNDKDIIKSNHYFVFGYRVIDEEFYGRD